MKLSLKNIIAQPAAGERLALQHLEQMPAPIKSLVTEKLAALRDKDAVAFENSTARIQNAFRKSECSEDIAVAQAIIAEQKAVRGVEATAPLQLHLDAAIELTPRHLYVKERLDGLRSQGLPSNQVIPDLAAELGITRASLQRLLRTVEKFTPPADRNCQTPQHRASSIGRPRRPADAAAPTAAARLSASSAGASAATPSTPAGRSPAPSARLQYPC